jgi:hypothetical protein
MESSGENKDMKKITAYITCVLLLAVLLSCKPEPATEYAAYAAAAPEKAVLVLNAHSESISAYDPAENVVYNNIQTVGHSGTNKAIPADLLLYGGNIHVLLSGQNSIETYNKVSLDYVDKGKHYFKNGYNPMAFIPVPGRPWVFTAGFETDEIQAVNLTDAETDYSFYRSFEAVTLPEGAHTETKAAASAGNAVGDNKRRSSTGGAVLAGGTSSRLYITNVRYDPTILMTEPDGTLAEYPESSGTYVRAPGYFREATLSIFSFNEKAMVNGAPDSSLAVSLVKEINLESLFYEAAASGSYFPGNGLNPQSAFILDGRLNIICTGTNGGSIRNYTSEEYIPAGYSEDDVKPGTDPDDGVVIILDISSPDTPVYMTHLAIGGSPAGFREAVDPVRKIVYLAGVGGIQSYSYGSSAADYSVMHSSSDMILASAQTADNFYSGLSYDTDADVLFVSSYTDDSINTINVTGTAGSPGYTYGTSVKAGDGPGALSMLQRLDEGKI